MVRRLSAKEARDRFAEILGQVHFGKDTVIVEKQGKPVAAVIDMERYERLAQAWDAPFAVLDRIQAKNRDKNPAQVERDVAAAIAEVRAAPHTKSRKRAKGGPRHQRHRQRRHPGNGGARRDPDGVA